MASEISRRPRQGRAIRSNHDASDDLFRRSAHWVRSAWTGLASFCRAIGFRIPNKKWDWLRVFEVPVHFLFGRHGGERSHWVRSAQRSLGSVGARQATSRWVRSALLGSGLDCQGAETGCCRLRDGAGPYAQPRLSDREPGAFWESSETVADLGGRIMN